MTAKEIARIIPSLQAVTLAKHNLDLAKKKKVKAKDLLKTGTTNIVGTNLLRINAQMIEDM